MRSTTCRGQIFCEDKRLVEWLTSAPVPRAMRADHYFAIGPNPLLNIGSWVFPEPWPMVIGADELQ